MINSKLDFFAAANSYDGFISYFNEVFCEDEYSRIFILKGGPGTGKSSFMKAVASHYNSEDFKIERVFCSSDPKSLDGVIIAHKDKMIAILDGTSPHTFEPTIPGAVHKIINLGNAWDETLLENNIDILKRLINLKKNCYANAYEYLALARAYTKTIDETVKPIFKMDFNLANALLKEIEIGDGKEKIRLISAFCKDGFFELSSFGKIAAKEIKVIGIHGIEYQYMRDIYTQAKRLGYDMIVSPSPLDKEKIDSIYFENSKTVISTEKKEYTDNVKVIDTARYVDVNKLNFLKMKLESLEKERELMLWNAADEFKKASDAHFEMEKVYTAAMDFNKNKKLIKATINDINRIFGTLNL